MPLLIIENHPTMRLKCESCGEVTKPAPTRWALRERAYRWAVENDNGELRAWCHKCRGDRRRSVNVAVIELRRAS